MSKIKTRAFDVANHLCNEEDIARARGMAHLCQNNERPQSFDKLLGVIRSLGYQLAIVPSHSLSH